MGHDGSAYDALIANLSLGGALVEVNDDIHLRVGDLCNLVLSDNSAIFPLKRPSKIIRFDSNRKFGVSFLHQ